MLAPWPIGDKRTCQSDLCNNACFSTNFFLSLRLHGLWVFVFRLQRLRLACLMGKFSELPDQAETGELLLEALRVRRQTDGV